MDINLYSWAMKWNIPPAAVDDLRQQMGLDSINVPAPHGGEFASESRVSSAKRLSFAQQGGLLWRNNVGAMQDQTGRVVRYGLANESKKMNTYVKSSDLIGIQPTIILNHMVGTTIGKFVAIETKKEGWKYNSNDPHSVAQLKFMELIISRGGTAYFQNSVDGVVKDQ